MKPQPFKQEIEFFDSIENPPNENLSWHESKDI
jgi:hypothetical protein